MSHLSEVLTDMPLAFYEGNDLPGLAIADHSDNGRDIAVIGEPTSFGNSIGGIPRAILWPHSTAVYGATPTGQAGTSSSFTIIGWVYLTANPAGQFIVSAVSDGTTGTSANHLTLFLTTAGLPGLHNYNGGTHTSITGTALALNTWHQLVGVVDSVNGMSLRVDKVDVASANGATNKPASLGNRGFRIHAGWNNAGGSGYAIRQSFYNYVISTARSDAQYDAFMDDSVGPITSLTAVPFHQGCEVTLSNLPAWSSSLEYRVNGGSVSSYAFGKYVTITGLTNGVSSTVEVRGVNGVNVGAWTSIAVTALADGIYDGFNRADVVPGATALGNTTSGHTWANVTGNMGIISGGTYVTAAVENIMSIDSGVFNHTLEYEFRGSDGCGVVRLRDVNNFWIFNGSQFYRRINGTYTSFWNNGSTVAVGTIVKIACKGETVKLYLNNVLKYFTEDNLSISTDTKFAIRSSVVSGKSIDNVKAYLSKTTDFPTLDASFQALFPDSLTASEQAEDSWLFKGRDTKVLDTGVIP